MKSIASRDNPLLKHVRKLIASPAARREAGQTLLDGPHLVDAYLRAHPAVPLQIIVDDDRRDSPEIERLLAMAEGAELIAVGSALFKSISPSETPSGIAAVISIPPVSGSTPGNSLLLEGVQDPGNVGSLLRTALAAGFFQVYLSRGCADPWSPKCLRGGMGAQFNLGISTDVDLVQWLEEYPGTSVACDPRAEKSIFELELSTPLAVVMGAEGLGLSTEVLSATRHRCRIPMTGGTESLNVGAAAAVVMYESVRQTHMKHGEHE